MRGVGGGGARPARHTCDDAKPLRYTNRTGATCCVLPPRTATSWQKRGDSTVAACRKKAPHEARGTAIITTKKRATQMERRSHLIGRRSAMWCGGQCSREPPRRTRVAPSWVYQSISAEAVSELRQCATSATGHGRPLNASRLRHTHHTTAVAHDAASGWIEIPHPRPGPHPFDGAMQLV